MVDGELVALTDEGRERIEEIAKEKKAEIVRICEEEEEEEKRAITHAEKAEILRGNLFTGRRRGLFGEAVRGMR